MFNLSPSDWLPFVLAIAAALGAMMFSRNRDATRPYGVAAAVLWAVAAACVILGIISWSTRLMH